MEPSCHRLLVRARGSQRSDFDPIRRISPSPDQPVVLVEGGEVLINAILPTT